MTRYTAILILLFPLVCTASAWDELNDEARKAVATFASRVAHEVHPSIAKLQTPQSYEEGLKGAAAGAPTKLPLGYDNWKKGNPYPACDQLAHIALLAMERYQDGSDMEPLYRGIEKSLLPDSQEVARALVAKSEGLIVEKPGRVPVLRHRGFFETVRDSLRKPKEADEDMENRPEAQIAKLYRQHFYNACAYLSIPPVSEPTVGERMAIARQMQATRAAALESIRANVRPSRCAYAKFFAGHALNSRMRGVRPESLYDTVLGMGTEQLHLLGVVKVAYEKKLDPDAKAGQVVAEFESRVHHACMTEDSFLAPLRQ